MTGRDDLTGLLTRGSFQHAFDGEMQRALQTRKPLSLLMIDLDYLKTFNDHYGHATGDAALVAAAAVLIDTLRAADIAGRLGGDEFVAFLPETGLDETLGVAERLRAAAAGTSIPVAGGSTSLRLSMSIGVACCPDDGQTTSDLMAAADRASYAAKAAGRNTVRATIDAGPTTSPEPLDGVAPAGRMVGRLAELVALRRQLESTIAGNGGGLIVVEGEGGIGKSRLLAEFAGLAAMLGARVLQATCREGDAVSTCAPFVRALAPVTTAAGGTRSGSGPVSTMAPRRGIAGSRFGTGLAGSLTGDDRRHMIGAITGVIERLAADNAGYPAMVIIFDHPRWADPANIVLLGRLAHSALSLPLLLVCASRPDELRLLAETSHAPDSATIAGARDFPGPTRLRFVLAPLTDSESKELLLSATGATLLSATVRRLSRACAGNPLLLTEAAKAARLKGTPRLPARITTLPSAVAALFASCLAPLDAEELNVLQYAALVPQPISTPLLARACGLDLSALTPILTQLTSVRLLCPIDVESRYAFVFAQMRDYLIDQLPAPKLHDSRFKIARLLVAHGMDGARVRPKAQPRSRAARISARLLGGCEVRVEGKEITPDQFKDRAAWTMLLALLATPGHVLPAEAAGIILWPVQHRVSRIRVNRTLQALNEGLQPCGAAQTISLRRDQTIAFHSDVDVAVDIELFENAAVQAVADGDVAAIRSAIALHGGPLLSGVHDVHWAELRHAQLGALLARLTRAQAAALPSGVVTLLMVSIDRSAALWEDYPHAMRQAVLRYDALVTSEVASQYGHITAQRGEAEGLCAVFVDPRHALAAAVRLSQSLQREHWPPAPLEGELGVVVEQRELDIRVRMSVHIGPLDLRNGMYSGLALHRCGQLRELAHPGQIVVSQATRNAVGDDSTAPELRVLGSRLFPGSRQREDIFQIVHPDLPDNFLGLAPSLEPSPSNLPVELTSFVGRRREMAAVRTLLSRHHLVTLVGPGGAGKTRLALQAASTVLGDHADGVWLVDLASILDPDLVLPAMSGALAVRDEPGRTPIEQLQAHLKARRLLIVLDNCEHLLERCADVVISLLRTCPALRVLATSREPLEIAGECVYAVPALSVPVGEKLPTLQRLAGYEAVKLFLDRAAARQFDFTLTMRNAAAIASICIQLEGVPLAVELAAAQVTALTVEQIAAGLENSLELLGPGPRSAAPRQRTLRATMDWSYRLLDDRQRKLLRGLAVFVGGWPVDAVAGINMLDPDHEQGGTTQLDDLVTKSLVRVDSGRYRLLETMRQYGWEKLEQAGELELLRDRHLTWFLQFACRAAQELTGPEQQTWMDLLEREHDNIRAALGWSLQGGELRVGDDGPRAHAGLRLAASIQWFWSVRNHWSEGRRWCEALVAASPNASLDARAEALTGLAGLAERQSDFETSRRIFAECLELRRRGSDRIALAGALKNLGNAYFWLGQNEPAKAFYAESLAMHRELDNKPGIAGGLNNLALIAEREQDFVTAESMLLETLSICRELGHRWGIAVSTDNLGNVAHARGDYALAIRRHSDSVDEWRSLGDAWSVALVQANLAIDYYRVGDTDQSLHLYAEALPQFEQLADPTQFARCLAGFALCAYVYGQPDLAVTLYAAAESCCARTGVPTDYGDSATHGPILADLRERSPESAFRAAWDAGTALDNEAAVTLTRGVGRVR